MQYTYISAAFLALASTVAGQVFFDAIQTPQRDEVLPAGKPFDLAWNPLDVKGTATIQLLNGPSNISLQLGPIIKTGVNNQDGKYTWTPEDLGFATYGWTITLDSDKTKTQTSLPFSIKNAGASTTTVRVSPGPSYTSTVSSTSSNSPSTTTSTASKPSVTSSEPTASKDPNSNSTSTTVQTSVRTSTPIGSETTPTTSPPAESSSAAMGNIVSGGFVALGGMLMAFAL